MLPPRLNQYVWHAHLPAPISKFAPWKNLPWPLPYSCMGSLQQTQFPKLGRWSSNTYLIYIQCQIGQLTVGIATAMARILHFHNVST